ncbi:MAG: hypothetical protein SFV19_07025 [Rhodospirillaceae bacterium]|nr:hypothetical protein [Rhodospirillaceae bacterium]
MAIEPVDVEIEDSPDHGGRGRLDIEPLFLPALVADLAGGDMAIAKGRAAIVEAPPGVFLHGSLRMLAVFFAGMLIEHRHDLADHLGHGIVAKVLGDGDELDIPLAQAADIELKLEGIAEEARIAVHDDGVERTRLALGVGEHLLECRALVVGRTRARLHVSVDHQIPVTFRIAFDLGNLIRDREVRFSLPGGRHTGVDGNAHPSVPLEPESCSSRAGVPASGPQRV